MIIYQWRSSKSLEIATCCTSSSTLLLLGKVSTMRGKIETRYKVMDYGNISNNTTLTNNCCKKDFLDSIKKKLEDQGICKLINYKVRFFFFIKWYFFFFIIWYFFFLVKLNFYFIFYVSLFFLIFYLISITKLLL